MRGGGTDIDPAGSGSLRGELHRSKVLPVRGNVPQRKDTGGGDEWWSVRLRPLYYVLVSKSSLPLCFSFKTFFLLLHFSFKLISSSAFQFQTRLLFSVSSSVHSTPESSAPQTETFGPLETMM